MTPLPPADWYAALTLRERVDAWRRAGAPAAADGFDARVADWRMGEWRTQRPFEEDARFANRLDALGIGEAAFRMLLGTPAATLRDWMDGETPAWMASLARILAGPEALPALPLAAAHRGMLEVFAPFVADPLARFAAAAAAIGGPDDAPPFARDTAPFLLLGALLTRVLTAVSRVLTLELHVARMQGVLAGETAEARFVAFVERFRTPEHRDALLREYPVLARALVRIGDQWVETGTELLRRLHEDRESILAALNGGAPLGDVVRIDGAGVGDVHRGGRSVAILHFSSGLRLVYKPRSLAVDRAFGDLLAWVNEAGACPPLRAPATVDRGTHGWVEFVRAEPAAGPEAVDRYYERLGGLMAVLHAVDGQDMHMENIVAAGEHPVAVDLETLFHPLPEDAFLVGAPAGDSREPARFLAASVLKMGLLPQRVWGDTEGGGVDLSAVGGAGNQAVSTRGLRLEGAGTDDMRFTRGAVVTEASQNRPGDEASGFDPAHHADALDRGFAAVYRVLETGRDDPEMRRLLEAFGPIPLRVIMRPTRTYGVLQTEGSHPDFLRDAVELDRFLDRLWLGVEAQPALAPLIPHESRGLHEGDIPAFFAAPDGRDLLSDTGDVLANYFPERGMDRVRERLAAFSPDDLDRQRRLVRGAMATLVESPLVPRISVSDAAPSVSPGDDEREIDAAALVARAEAVAERLAARAVRGARTAGWPGVSTHDGVRSVSGLVRHDLHGGLPGILAFLARLGEATGSGRHDALAAQAMALLGDQLHGMETRVRDVGGFAGLGGLLPALAAVDARWPGLGARPLAARAIGRIAALTPGVARRDVFGGLAGAAAGLLSYHAATGDAAAADAAAACGARLLSLLEGGEAAPAAPRGGEHGFAFGTAGVAWALLHLAEATGDERFAAAGREALDGAWAAWRDAPRDPRVDGTWCFGAAGFALAHAAAGDARGAADAVEIALRDGVSHASHAPCNGSAGALDAALEVAPLLSADFRPRIEAATRSLLVSIDRDGWRCGVPLGVESPGLMNGLAGIGYGLLRVAHPHRVPSLLALGLPAPSRVAPPAAAPALEGR